MAQPTANVEVECRRTVLWSACCATVYVLNAVGIRMPRAVILYCARSPMQVRVAGGPWRTIRLDPQEIQRRFGRGAA